MTARLDYIPKAYQGPLTEHMLVNPRCAGWAGMGMGKTVATLTAIDALRLVGETAPTLVIAPLRVAKNTWPAECRKWNHLRHLDVMPIVGNEAERTRATKRDYPIYSTNYDNLVWLTEHYGDRWPFNTVISDESTRLAGFRTKQGTARSRALGALAHTKIDRFVELTGTPAPNGLKKLWGQLWFLDAGQRLGRTYSAFESRWFAYQRAKDAAGGWNPAVKPIVLPYAQEQIQDLIRDICLTLDAKDYFPDLKEPIVSPVYVDLPSAARARYREMEKKLYTEIDGRSVEAFNAAAKTQKLLQLANGAVYVDPLAENDDDPRAKEWREVHNAKLDALESVVEEANGMPVFVSYEFKSDLARILKAFPKARYLDDSQQTIDDWNAGRIPMLLSHPKGGGHGLNLQDGGNIICYFGNNWDLELYLQILERIGPMRQLQSGHDRNVHVIPIIARDTVEETVIARRAGKEEVQSALLESMKRRVLN